MQDVASSSKEAEKGSRRTLSLLKGLTCVWVCTGRKITESTRHASVSLLKSVRQDPMKAELFIQAGTSLVTTDRINIHW